MPLSATPGSTGGITFSSIERLYRPAEVFDLRGNPGKAREKFGWEPELTFADLIPMMVDADIQALKVCS